MATRLQLQRRLAKLELQVAAVGRTAREQSFQLPAPSVASMRIILKTLIAAGADLVPEGHEPHPVQRILQTLIERGSASESVEDHGTDEPISSAS